MKVFLLTLLFALEALCQITAPASTAILIPDTTFTMGSLADAYAKINETPDRNVSVTMFVIMDREVTEGFYDSVMSNTSMANDSAKTTVTWFEAAQFCNTLSIANGLDSCYNTSTWACDTSKNGFRLPFEAEWEVACRSGTFARWYSGVKTRRKDDIEKIAWTIANSQDRIHPGAEKDSSDWGLYDMLGNAEEWCQDWYAAYSSADTLAPMQDNSSSGLRVARGGHILSGGYTLCRSSARHFYKPTEKNGLLGFRIARKHR